MDDAVMRNLITQYNMKAYCEEELFEDLRLSMKELLTQIAVTGELDRHWGAMQKANDLIKKNARKEAHARKRLEQGDAYDSSNESIISETENETDSEDYDSEQIDEEDISNIELERSQTFREEALTVVNIDSPVRVSGTLEESDHN